MSRILVSAVAIGALASCGHEDFCETHPKAQLARLNARSAYDGGNYSLAKTLYMNAVEWCEDNYEPRIGLAHTCRVYGNELFQAADQLARQGRMDQAGKKFAEAKENHVLADRLFRTAMTEREDDLDPHYGIGLLWYEECTSPIAAPYAPNDAENRPRVRDEAIKEFSIVLAKQPDSSQARRYRGLTLLAADRVEEGAQDLKVYHDSRQDLYNKIVASWPGLTTEEKKRKDVALRAVEKEIDDVREVIVLEHGEMLTRAQSLRKKEAPTPKETQEIAHLSSQQILLEGMIKSWSLTKMGEIEQAVVKRCREYLVTFERGKLADVLSFLAPRKGEEARLRQAITAKVEQGTKFRKVNIRSATVLGETATVGFACEIVTEKGGPVGAEVTLRWRLMGGQWLVSDHP